MFRFLCVYILVFNFLRAESNDLPKEMKTLILIIATDDKPAYQELQKIWEVYMNSDPEHFEVYFLRADPDISSDYEIRANEIIVRNKESYIPGILEKTLLGIKAMLPRMHEFDYVIRTNLSSFYPFNNLFNYLASLPKEKCYAGVSLYQTKELGLPQGIRWVNFVSGAGIILSRDMAELIVNKSDSLDIYKNQMPDDVFIGLFFNRKKIPIIKAQRWDYPSYDLWLENNEKIEDYAYHFRARNGYAYRTVEDPFADELLTLKALLRKYYPDLVLEQN